MVSISKGLPPVPRFANRMQSALSLCSDRPDRLGSKRVEYSREIMWMYSAICPRTYSRQLAPERLTQAHPHAYGPDSRNGVAFSSVPSFSLQASGSGGVPPIYLLTLFFFRPRLVFLARLCVYFCSPPPLLNGYLAHLQDHAAGSNASTQELLTSTGPAVSPEFPLPSPLLKTRVAHPVCRCPICHIPSETTPRRRLTSHSYHIHTSGPPRVPGSARLPSHLLLLHTPSSAPGSVPCLIFTVPSPPIFTLLP